MAIIHLRRISQMAGYILAFVFLIVLGSGMPAFSGGIVISEISYNPIGGSDYEFVELYNSGNVAKHLEGYQFSNGIAYTFPPGVSLAPGDYLVVVKALSFFSSRYPGVLNIAPGVYTGSLDNAGEKLTLISESGTTVFSVDYDDKGQWPKWADGYGGSLVLKVMEGDPNNPASWCAGDALNGTPGKPGSCAVPGIVINEVLVHTDPPFEDAIELYNPAGENIDIGGWYLSDDAENRKKYRIPDNTVINANGYNVFYEYQFNSNPGADDSFALSSTFGDEVFLTAADGSGNLTDFVDMVEFGPSENGIPFGLYPNATGLFVALEWQTFGRPNPVATLPEFRTGSGAANAGPKIGPVIISEIMYHPPDIGDPPVNNTGHEYIELHNICQTPVNLFDSAHPENTWKITSAVDFTFPQGITIPPDGYILIIGTSDVEGFRTAYGLGADIPIFGPWTGSLDNSGESIRLEKPDSPDGDIVPYIQVDRVDYADTHPWPAGPDGNGYSLERRTPTGLGMDALTWQAGPIAGTPGAANSAPPPIPSKILINEFLASNETIECPPNPGSFSDWIELYNPAETGAPDIDLRGYYLTDDLDEPTKWTIPNGTMISPASFLVFHADETDIGLHTNFKLSKDGGTIALFSPQGVLVDFIIYGPQQTDVSYGRQPDGASAWYFFESPACGESNNGSVRQVVLKDAIIALQIVAGMPLSPSKTIGINGDVNGDAKTGMEEVIFILQSISGMRTENINFLSEGYEPLFTHGALHEVEIVISQAEWDGLIQDMKDYIKTGNYRKATFIYHGPAGEATIEDVGFRVKGNISRVIPQDDSGNFHRAHFKVKFNHEFDLGGETTQQDEQRKGRRFCSLRELIFRMPSPGPPTWDKSQIRELFSYDVLNRAGCYTSRTGSVRLTITIDGVKRYFGVYTLEESIDMTFLSKRYGTDKDDGNLYKCIIGDSGPASLEPVDGIDGPGNATAIFPEKRIIGMKDWKTKYRPTYDLETNEDEADHAVLLEFIDRLNSLSGPALKTYMDANFEMDRFLRYLAMNMLLSRWDDYTTVGNNYYLYFANNGGKIEFMTTDNDSALGASQLFYTPAVGIYDWVNHANELISFLVPEKLIPEGWTRQDMLNYFNSLRVYQSPLTHKVFEIPEYRNLYEHYLKEFITPANKLFLYSEYEKKFNQLHALYSPHLNNDINEGEEMVKEESVRLFFYEKTKSIIEQLGLNKADYETGPLSLDAPTGVRASDAASSEMITVTWTLAPFADYYRVYRSGAADGQYAQINGNITGSSLNDGSVPPETTYYYKVKAFTDQGVGSDFSTIDQGSTAPSGVSPPLGVRATDGFYKHMVTITWQAHINADYYRVYRSDTMEGNYAQISGDITAATVNDKTVAGNTTYHYRVRAFTNEGETSGFSDSDAGSASDAGLGAPDIIYGARLVEGTYSNTDLDGNTTSYTFFSNGTCTKKTPNKPDPNWPIIDTAGTWSYSADGKKLNINTSGTGYGGFITINLIEVWENAFTDESGTYLNLMNLKKVSNDPDGILGSYEARGSVRAITGGGYISDSTTSIDVRFNMNADSTWDIVFNVSGQIFEDSGVQEEGNGLMTIGGSYYIPLPDWLFIYNKQLPPVLPSMADIGPEQGPSYLETTAPDSPIRFWGMYLI
jgi:hypothetical protein